MIHLIVDGSRHRCDAAAPDAGCDAAAAAAVELEFAAGVHREHRVCCDTRY